MAALLLHGVVLTGLPTTSGEATAPLPPVQLRALAPVVVPVRPPPSTLPTPGPLPAATALARPPAALSVPARAAPTPTTTRSDAGEADIPTPVAIEPVLAASAAEPVAAVTDGVAEPASAPAPPSAVRPLPFSALPASGASPAVAGDGEEPIPVYATRLAPPQSLAYALRRGLLSGHAVLNWRVEARAEPGAAYALDLVARVAGVALMTQTSQGQLDADGLAPQRFTDQRLRGSTQAANFQRQRGVISFSGPPVEHPLRPGVQDRLSWMLQLPAIVDATPTLASPGQAITLAVVGARGDAAVWTFRFEAVDTVATATGEVMALKFVRLPRKPHDTRAEVWLDPAHHHLPVRARIGNPPEGEVLELLRAAP